MGKYVRIALIVYLCIGHGAMLVYWASTVLREMWHDLRHGITVRPLHETWRLLRTMVLLFVAWPYVAYRDLWVR